MAYRPEKYMAFVKGASCALALAVGIASPAFAERAPRSAGADARVRTVMYNEVDVIRIDTQLRVNTAIELGKGERISQVLLGDSESYEVEVLSNRNTISIKPVIGKAHSNMTVYTNRRAIAFYLTEGASNTPTFRVTVQYPDERPARTVAAAGTPGSRDSGYSYSGKGEFRPVKVWNDGRNTFFEFTGETRPSIFGVNAQGYEVTTNSTTRGRIVKVTGISNEYSIRVGDQVICIKRIEGGAVYEAQIVAALQTKEF